jgi:thiamine pyrophosphokinase
MAAAEPGITLLIGAAPLSRAGRAQLSQLIEQASLIVAADGGARHLVPLKRAPDWLVGDLDSLPAALLRDLPASTRVQRHPTDKDSTDMELALRLALEQGEPGSEIVMSGCLGGRIDHSLANLQLGTLPELEGRRLRFVDGEQQAWVLVGPSRLCIDGAIGDHVSLLPLTELARIERTSGLRWPLREDRLGLGSSLGISNRMEGSRACLELEAGCLLCVHIPADSRMLSVDDQEPDSAARSGPDFGPGQWTRSR